MALVLHLLASLDRTSLMAMFWYPIFLEVPRFLAAGAIAAAIRVNMRSKARRRSAKHRPVSVLIPCHNGSDGLLRTITSLREQTLRPLQIVVVDDGSSDDTARVGRQLHAQGIIEVFLSTGLRGGKSAALNLGFGHCTGAVVVSADADTTFHRDAMEMLAAEFDDPRIGAVGGNVGVRNPHRSLLAAMQSVEYMIGISLGRQASALLGIPPVVSGAFAGFRREALASVGGWEAGAGEDADLSLKLQQAGWKLTFAARAWALTDVPATLRGLFRQRLRWESDLVRLHTRKFLTLLYPWRRNFSLSDTIGTIDALLFSVGLSCAFLVYLAWVVAHYGALAAPILLATAFVYSLVGTLNFMLAAATTDERAMLRSLPYALGYGFYCIGVLHPIRIWACVDELVFYGSYRSTFVPKRVLGRLWRF